MMDKTIEITENDAFKYEQAKEGISFLIGICSEIQQENIGLYDTQKILGIKSKLSRMRIMLNLEDQAEVDKIINMTANSANLWNKKRIFNIQWF